MAVIDRNAPRVIDEWKDGERRYRIVESGESYDFARTIESSERVDAMGSPIWQVEATQKPNSREKTCDDGQLSGLSRGLLVRILELHWEAKEAKRERASCSMGDSCPLKPRCGP